MGLMASEREDYFNPLVHSHLKHINWKNANHRRSVLACLVQGVYSLQRDRHEKPEDSQALAPPWWESFHFELLRPLVDDDLSIFGAIYEYKPPTSDYNDSIGHSPRYVIAFRGTLFTVDTFVRDIKLDVRIIRNKLHQASRFKIGMQAVQDKVAAVGESNVWLAGHSLGAAMAMLAGRTMAKTGIFLESFLFNPPFVSAPIARIKNKYVKRGVRITHSVTKAALALTSEAKNQILGNVSENPFARLSAWFPYLFVNRADPICCEYIDYFEHRIMMEKIGAGCIEKIATQHSVRGLLKSAVGKDKEAAEPFHLIPSANLTVNETPTEDCENAHGILQWCIPDLGLPSEDYSWNM